MVDRKGQGIYLARGWFGNAQVCALEYSRTYSILLIVTKRPLLDRYIIAMKLQHEPKHDTFVFLNACAV